MSASARIHRSTTQTITNNTRTAISHDVVDLDNIGMAVLATSPTLLTCKQAGWYLVQGCVPWAVNATGARYAILRLNNATDFAQDVRPAANTDFTMNVSGYQYLNVGDTVQLDVIQTSGGNLAAGYPGFIGAALWAIRQA